jgi:DNA-binding MarR family transcriptional regulator
MTELILLTFRVHGALIASGDRLTGAVGLTAARWQVLSSVARAAHPGPVAHVARDMGLTRQSVQRIADRLVADGLLAFEDNPHHKRAPRVVVTPQGREAFARVTARQVPWVNDLACVVPPRDIATTIAVLQQLRERLDQSAAPTTATARPRRQTAVAHRTSARGNGRRSAGR